jgi:asparagine synthase (glutamine-hydrolysing)
MPGLIGYIQDHRRSVRTLHLDTMAAALEPEERFRRDLYEQDGIGLGRVSLGILQPVAQPVWNEDQSVGAMMEGEFYDAGDLRREMQQRGHHLKSGSDVELALCLYEQFGDDFASRVKGAFTIAIWDQKQRKLLLTNDRLGLYPLYYAQTVNGLIFASGVRALFADPELPRDTDPIAMAQFLTFDHMLDDRTLLQAAKLLPQAVVFTYSNGAANIRRYWSAKYAEQFPLRDEDEYVEELNHHLKQAAARQAQDDLRKGLLLSGGLDSRVILAYLAELLPAHQIQTFTWGIRGCDDARFGRELANLCGAPHHFLELKPDWLLTQANEAVRITDGLGNIFNLHALAAAKEAGSIAQVIFKGFMGDAMMGFAIRRRFFANYSDSDWWQAHLQTHRDQGVITFEAKDKQQLFTPEFQRGVGDAVFESYRAGMRAAGVSHMSGQRLYFDMTQRVPRMTIHGVEVVRSYAAVRLPFCDYDLWDFTMNVPPGYLYERYLIHRAFSETFPKFAKVPIAQTGLPMISCARDVLLRGKQFVQWHLRSAGLERLAGPAHRPYKDYHNWLRTVLKDWAFSILLSPSALQRGYFQPEYIRKLLDEHMSGVNHTTRLGALLSLELWHQQFIDRSIVVNKS